MEKLTPNGNLKKKKEENIGENIDVGKHFLNMSAKAWIYTQKSVNWCLSKFKTLALQNITLKKVKKAWYGRQYSLYINLTRVLSRPCKEFLNISNVITDLIFKMGKKFRHFWSDQKVIICPGNKQTLNILSVPQNNLNSCQEIM